MQYSGLESTFINEIAGRLNLTSVHADQLVPPGSLPCLEELELSSAF
jgi:hypothetical protein